ncbi:MAG: hypothetical protein KatS3mg008_0294 [Acidimicrobiales bacterium]|nr:MAG: hypothetical protein KatS3mg008_0294 [Acidimicrobiales bacterium]
MNSTGARFCSSCGAELDGDRTQQSPLPDLADADESASLAGASFVEELAPGEGALVVNHGPLAGARFLLNRDVTTLGRHPDSDVFLDDVTVSRRHAEIHRRGDVFEVRDVGSLNGTYVNRQRVESAVLAHGDRLQVGRYRFLFLQRRHDQSVRKADEHLSEESRDA